MEPERNQKKKKEGKKENNFLPNGKSTGSSWTAFTPIGANVRVILQKMCHLKCVSAGEIHAALNAQYQLPASPGCFSVFLEKVPGGVLLNAFFFSFFFLDAGVKAEGHRARRWSA